MRLMQFCIGHVEPVETGLEEMECHTSTGSV
jgi:hypothetical protein